MKLDSDHHLYQLDGSGYLAEFSICVLRKIAGYTLSLLFTFWPVRPCHAVSQSVTRSYLLLIWWCTVCCISEVPTALSCQEWGVWLNLDT